MQTPPYITTDQMREVDRLMIEDYGITLMQMMENAGRNLAALARARFLNNQPQGKRVVVLAGKGGNGGGGLVAARRLHNWGAQVSVLITHLEEAIQGVPYHQLCTIQTMGITIQYGETVQALPQADLLVDAILGYSLSGAPRGTTAHLIHLANKSGVPILSLDTPSGLNTTSGKVHHPHITADATMTLALPKTGLAAKEAQKAVGELYLADISVPPGLYASLGFSVEPVFAKNEIVRLY